MTPDEIRRLDGDLFDPDSSALRVQTRAQIEIAAQLAELNQHLKRITEDGGLIHLIDSRLDEVGDRIEQGAELIAGALIGGKS